MYLIDRAKPGSDAALARCRAVLAFLDTRQKLWSVHLMSIRFGTGNAEKA